VITNDGWEAPATDIIGLHDYEQDATALTARYGEPGALAAMLESGRIAGRRATLVGQREGTGRSPASHDAPGSMPVMLTEFGGMRVPTTPADAPGFPVAVSEKGANWVRIRLHGTPGHASTPLRADNALIKAAIAVQRIAEFQPQAQTGATWARFVAGLGLPPEIADALRDPAAVEGVIDTLPDVGLARLVHACTHTTLAPTILHAGVKTNVIPDTADIEVDVRSLEGEGPDDVEAMIRTALGDLADGADVEITISGRATSSPVETPLWDSVARVTGALVPGAT